MRQERTLARLQKHDTQRRLTIVREGRSDGPPTPETRMPDFKHAAASPPLTRRSLPRLHPLDTNIALHRGCARPRGGKAQPLVLDVTVAGPSGGCGGRSREQRRLDILVDNVDRRPLFEFDLSLWGRPEGLAGAASPKSRTPPPTPSQLPPARLDEPPVRSR